MKNKNKEVEMSLHNNSLKNLCENIMMYVKKEEDEEGGGEGEEELYFGVVYDVCCFCFNYNEHPISTQTNSN